MVAEIRIEGDVVIPVFLVPGQDDDAPADQMPAEAEDGPVRTMVRSVGRAGLEPATEGS
jgi:site-specific DNA recombinase